MGTDEALAALRRIATRHDGLRLLVLHGSRARDGAHSRSDWDLGYLADARMDPAALHVDVSSALRTDDIDLTDLARASALLRFEAAGHGRCVYEATAGAYGTFVLEATLFWCDAEPVFRRAQAAVLAGLSG